MDTCTEFFELARNLNQERLFVESEKQHLQNLNERVQKTVEYLFHIAWIAKQQRINLDGLILSKPDSTPSACCQKANMLENIKFVDSYKHLGIHEFHYGEFIQSLRSNPELIAMCLAAGQKLMPEDMHRVVNIIVDSVYGHCMLHEDEQLVLKVLKHLMEMQLATNDNPRRLLRHGTCAFGRVYKVFNEGLFSAKLFLTGALHDAIMHLLMEDKLFLDIDPSKAVVRFPRSERLLRFGTEGTAQYANNLQKYRTLTISKLANLTNKFIAGIRNNLYCFPSSLLWLVKQLYSMVMKARKVEVREVGAMCADLVFAFFICPAIVNPEPYGICDAPISHIARFNLMQVAQILQVLAMAKWEEFDPKLMDLYGRFEKDSMSSVLDFLLEGGVDDCPPTPGIQLQGLVRTAVLITETELNCLIHFLQHVMNNSGDGWVDTKTLQRILSSLPSSSLKSSHSASNSNKTSDLTNSSVLSSPQALVSKKSLLGKVGKSRHGHKTSNSSIVEIDPSVPQQQREHYSQGEGDESTIHTLPEVEDVLVISLNVNLECPGMLTEHKVLSLDQQKKHGRVRMKLDSTNDDESRNGVGNGQGGEMQEKRTRFSLSHDQDSIGNTSDNLEAISEAASNHSVTSSLELENENDNLSDMISANVSGRGTPNVSGRDTPSSQVEGEERDQRPLDLPVTAQKQNREDISDKFGKFEIKGLIEGDEAVSMVSDTWSTDVLASDSETVEQGERAIEDGVLVGRSVAMDIGQSGGTSCSLVGNSSAVAGGGAALDVSEVASEAWSMDVTASDSERLQDVDTDDTGSIARSDDTGSLARSDEAGRYVVDADISISGSSSNLQSDALLRVEEAEHIDENVTPRASGSHSPIDGPTVGSLPSGSWLSTLHAAAGFKPITTDTQRPLTHPNKNILLNGDKNEAVDHQKLLMNDSSKETNKVDLRVKGLKAKAESAPDNFKYDHEKVVSSITTFDSLIERRTTSFESLENAKCSLDNTFSPPTDDTSSLEISGMQSLGRLSLAMEELSESDAIPHLSLLISTQNSTVDGIDINVKTASSDADVFVNVTSPHHSLQTKLHYDNLHSLPDSPMPQSSHPSTSVTQTDGRNCHFASDDACTSLPASAISNHFESEEVESKESLRCACKKLENAVCQTNDCAHLQNYSVMQPPSANYVKSFSIHDVDISSVRLSSASLGSSSSSSSGIGQDSASSKSVPAIEMSTPPLYSTDASCSPPVASPIPSASSGAIPKSISFDKSAERGDKEVADVDESKIKKGFFKSIKLTLKRPGRKGIRSQDEKGGGDVIKDEISADYKKYNMNDIKNKSHETGDDILAKYRKKPALVTSDDLAFIDSTVDDAANVRVPLIQQSQVLTTDEELLLGDVQNFEESYVFVDAKRKLRSALSNADPHVTPWQTNSIACRIECSDNKQDNKLVAFLKTQLAEAVNLQDKSLTAQLHETLRCISIFDKAGCKKLFKSLKEEYKCRYPYIAYLVRCRQGLLLALSHLERLLKRVERDKVVCSSFMIFVCVRFFLEKHERSIFQFSEDFQKLTVSDEKTEFVERFLDHLYQQMEVDPIWKGASAPQIEQAQRAIERNIMGKMYIHALYPNGDGDVHRDQVLAEHIKKLAKIITPDHKDLSIPKMYHYECPWPSAQSEIVTINAYKTPRDKLQCVVRCCTTIMNLLSMANHKSVPAADDFIPVLVFITIKANPANLLSTIQYVNSFYHKQLKGEEEYWWTQFCSAVEFIKTMDYTQ